MSNPGVTPQVPTGQTDAATGAAAQQQNSISSNPALMTALKGLFGQIGQHIGAQILTGQHQMGQTVTTAQPVVPTAMPADAGVPQGMPFAPRGNTKADYNTALATKLGTDLTNIFNTKLKEKHNQEVAAAQRDYEILMNAIAINKSLDPNNPEHQKMIEHNKQIIDVYLNDPKKMKRLEKVLGIEADLKANNAGQNADAAKKQKLESDPDYQALQRAKQAAATTVPGGGTTQTALDTGQQVPASNSGAAPMSEQIPGQKPGTTPTNIGSGPMTRYTDWVSTMSPKAQAFINQFPVGPSTTYIPSPEEVGKQWRIAAQIDPNGNTVAETAAKLHEYNVKGYGDIIKALNDRDLAQFTADRDFNIKKMDVDNAWNIAVLNAGIKQQENQLKAIELNYKDQELRQKNREYGNNYYQGRMDALSKQLTYLRDQRIALTDAWTKASDKKNRASIETDLQNVNSKESEITTQYFKARGDWENYNGAFRFGVTPTNTNPNAGKSAVQQFDQRQSSGGATGTQPSGDPTIHVPTGSTNR